jgi:hypothetical protein
MPFKGINKTCGRCGATMEMRAHRTKDQWATAVLMLICRCGNTVRSKSLRARSKAEELLGPANG